MQDFLDIHFWKNNYQYTKVAWWKDNITALIEFGGEKIVIQKTKVLPEKLKHSIENAIKVYCQNGLLFAQNGKQKRFINFENNTYSFMVPLVWNIISEENHTSKLMKQCAKQLACIHNISEKNNLWENAYDISIHKNLEKIYNTAKSYNENNNVHTELFEKFSVKIQWLWRSTGLRKWLLHWDPVFKNFMIDAWENITWIIDYEMMEYDDYLWDLVDMVRGNMKLDWFTKEQFWELISTYETIRPLEKNEKESLENYLKMMILNTWLRYLLALYPNSDYYDHIWNIKDTYNKAIRCLNESKKAELFFK